MLKAEDEMSTASIIIDARTHTFLKDSCTPEATIIRLVK